MNSHTGATPVSAASIDAHRRAATDSKTAQGKSSAVSSFEMRTDLFEWT
jgi:hypothetical protein